LIVRVAGSAPKTAGLVDDIVANAVAEATQAVVERLMMARLLPGRLQGDDLDGEPPQRDTCHRSNFVKLITKELGQSF
jgi:hypothetical protein